MKNARTLTRIRTLETRFYSAGKIKVTSWNLSSLRGSYASCISRLDFSKRYSRLISVIPSLRVYSRASLLNKKSFFRPRNLLLNGNNNAIKPVYQHYATGRRMGIIKSPRIIRGRELPVARTSRSGKFVPRDVLNREYEFSRTIHRTRTFQSETDACCTRARARMQICIRERGKAGEGGREM